jgi:hypothetical protein
MTGHRQPDHGNQEDQGQEQAEGWQGQEDDFAGEGAFTQEPLFGIGQEIFKSYFNTPFTLLAPTPADPAVPPKPDKTNYPATLPHPPDLTRINKRSILLTNFSNAADPNFPNRPISGSCL